VPPQRFRLAALATITSHWAEIPPGRFKPDWAPLLKKVIRSVKFASSGKRSCCFA